MPPIDQVLCDITVRNFALIVRLFVLMRYFQVNTPLSLQCKLI